jgi:hypothetical protein
VAGVTQRAIAIHVVGGAGDVARFWTQEEVDESRNIVGGADPTDKAVL